MTIPHIVLTDSKTNEPMLLKVDDISYSNISANGDGTTYLTLNDADRTCLKVKEGAIEIQDLIITSRDPEFYCYEGLVVEPTAQESEV